jgi:hypothetical protein
MARGLKFVIIIREDHAEWRLAVDHSGVNVSQVSCVDEVSIRHRRRFPRREGFLVVLWAQAQTQLEGNPWVVLNKRARFRSLMENECENAYRVHQASHRIQNFPTPVIMSSDINN